MSDLATRELIFEKLDRICEDVIAKNAPDLDREGRFPRENMTALGEAGLLGLLTAPEMGGLGLGLADAAAVTRRIARECPSTGMVLTMHYCGSVILEQFGQEEIRREIAAGRHITTLAFSEFGSRSHFWAPLSTATRVDGEIELNARKSWATSASEADSYVWSSKPLEGEELSTLWFVPRKLKGISVPGTFDGLGLRGNDSSPITAEGVRIPESNLLGEDGGGLGIMLEMVLPYFLLVASGVSVGLMQGALARTIGHVSGVAYANGDGRLTELPTIRAYVARMQNHADMGDALLNEALAAAGAGREDALRRILGCKSAIADAAQELVSIGMRVCGGSAFRKEVGLDRYFRDAQAATVMSPTTDILYDLVGRHLFGMPLL